MSKKSNAKPTLSSNAKAKVEATTNARRKHMFIGFGVMGAAAAALGSVVAVAIDTVTEVI